MPKPKQPKREDAYYERGSGRCPRRKCRCRLLEWEENRLEAGKRIRCNICRKRIYPPKPGGCSPVMLTLALLGLLAIALELAFR